jgi:rod shape-determining protein MreD
MRWIPFCILAYLTIALQMGLNGYLNIGRAAPDLVLPIAVFIAINARRDEALFGAFVLGLLQDLFTQQPFGLFAFSYGMMAVCIVAAQPALSRDHPLTHALVALLGGLLVGTIVCFNDWAYPRLHGPADWPAAAPSLALMRALYTAVAAPFLLLLLVRIKGVFGFRRSRVYRLGALPH